MTTMPLAKLVEDFSIYPRHAVDDGNVSSLANALKSGATLPAIVVEKKSNRIVDGWHRARAYRRVLGPEAAVDVEEIEYPSEGELLKDAVRRNSAHGRKLDTIDQVRAMTLCQERGISLQDVAIVLHIPEERLQKLSVRLATAEKSGPGTVPGTLTVALKRPVAHMAGEILSPEQMEAHGRAPGVSYLLLVTQLRDALGNGFINTDDERLMMALRGLADDLARFLKAHK